MSQFVLLLLEFWVHAFLEFAEELARDSDQYSYPALAKGIKGHDSSLTSSPESRGSAIEAQWIVGRAPYNLLNMAAACQEISAFVNADISLVIVLLSYLIHLYLIHPTSLDTTYSSQSPKHKHSII